MLTLVNGEVATALNVTDRGVSYGDGLFETIAVRDGQPRLWARHLQRLHDSCQRLQIPMPAGDLLRAELLQSIQGEHEAVVKIIITRGAGGRGYRFEPSLSATRIVSPFPWPHYPDSHRTQGVAVRWCRTPLARQPLLAGMKHLNRLEQVLARAEWQQEYTEGLMRDSAGQVIEGTMSNLFLVRRGILLTPDLSQCGVAGVMRAEVLDHARRLGIETRIQAVSEADLTQAEEVFITNAVIGIWPVSSLEARHYVVGKVTQALQAALSDSH